MFADRRVARASGTHPARPGGVNGTMRLRISLLAALLAAPLARPARAETASVVPNPAAMVREAGAFSLDAATPIVVPAHDRGARNAARFLRHWLRRSTGMRLAAAVSSPRRHAIEFIRAPIRATSREAYRLRVTPGRIVIEAPADAGLLYGAVTLWQLVPPGTRVHRELVPAVRVDDAPRFRWRGLLLDSVRHYQSPAYIRRFIGWMALHKLNVLHWHLTDDQGWRLQIKRYPLLTAIGAWRVPAGRAAARDLDPRTGRPRRYGGFYTQREVRELVAYAATRNVTIVPEIEMPGHALAALIAYPALASVTTLPRAVPSDWGIYDYPYNLDESTFAFLENVLTEVMGLFPSRYIHIGGDEVETDQWVASPEVRARAGALGLAVPVGLQPYFMRRIGRFLIAHGRRPVGWDEMLAPGLAKSAVIMSWHGAAGAAQAARQGNDAILAAWPTLYFDNRQSDSRDEPPGRGRVVTLEELYRFDPMPPGLDAVQRGHVRGVEGAVWTETMRTSAQLSEMTFPRAAAVAELGWSEPPRRHWRGFLARLGRLERLYDAVGLPHSRSVFAVRAAAAYDWRRAAAAVRLGTQGRYGEIRYTLDGTAPSVRSPLYRAPLDLALPAEIEAQNFDGDAALGPVLRRHFALAVAQRRYSQQLQLCTERLPLSLEDDAPLSGPRARFLVDIENPCWIYPHADLDHARGVIAAVGQVPFNFRIGADRAKIPRLAAGPGGPELQIHLDRCDGPMLARLALAPALAADAVTELPAAPLAAVGGIHDLCLRFTQAHLDPLWTLDWIQLTIQPPVPAAAEP